jgi:hypothetical protein
MRRAPFPNHGRTSRPLWQHLWATYSDVINPLRDMGLPTDVETCGGENFIWVELPDGSHLSISATEALPVDRDELTGWHVGHMLRDDRPGFTGLVYDSTEDGLNAANGADVAPLMAAITAHLDAYSTRPAAPDEVVELISTLLGITDVSSPQPPPGLDVVTLVASPESATDPQPDPQLEVVALVTDLRKTTLDQFVSGPYEHSREALKEYGWRTHCLAEEGWQLLFERGGTELPLTVWHRPWQLQVVVVNPAN